MSSELHRPVTFWSAEEVRAMSQPNDVLVERAITLIHEGTTKGDYSKVEEARCQLIAALEASPVEQMREALAKRLSKSVQVDDGRWSVIVRFKTGVDANAFDAALQLTDKGRVDNG